MRHTILLLALLLALPIVAQKEPVPVILTAGQSNADGRVPLSDLPSYISYKYCQWSYGSGDFKKATGDFELFNPTVARTTLGPRWGFDAIVYYLLEQQWQRPFYVIKQTMGGTAIDSECPKSTHGYYWSADAKTLGGKKSLLKSFTQQIDACMKKLPQNYDIKVLLWHQGESDMPRQEYYYDNLKAVIQHVRQHLVEVTGRKEYAHLPVICGTYASGSRQRPPKVVDALYRMERDDADFHVIDASDLSLLSDNIHFNAKGAEKLGHRVYDKLMSLLSGATMTGPEGLSRHDFLYAGESKQRRIFIIKDGQVNWQYSNPQGRGEISDAMLLADGHVLYAHQYGIAEVDKDGHTIWSYAAPAGTEIHTLQPIGRRHVLFIQNGHPAKVVVMKIPDCQVVYEFEIPASEGVHGQFRNARLSTRGTLLVAHMGQGYVAEYSVEGNELCRWNVPAPWSVSELEKEHLLIVGRNCVREIDRSGAVLREIKTSDYGIKSPQKAVRLKNGNIIVNDWWNEWRNKIDTLNAPVQAVEIDKDGHVVWQLKVWKNPDLGPSTTIQPLEQVVNRDRLFFGHFNGRSPKQMVGVNEALGTGLGIHSGRVAWIHSPGVATWDGHTGLWVEDRWNDQAKADAMVQEAVLQLSGESTVKKAWKSLFSHFNKMHGKGSRGYKRGEAIAIKLNLNNALTHHDTIELNSSPFTTLALVRSLVRDAGVRQQDIILCEPSRAITDSIYNKVYREFPQVRFIDNIGGDGREKCEYYPDQIVYSADNGKLARGLAKCIVDAEYLINSALLKTHVGPGVTLTAKNWYGATDIALQWRKNGHNNFSQDKRHGKPGYKTFVDFIAHKHLGQKTLLFLIDGTYGSRDVNGKPAPKWQKAPFNNDWACSLIVSQDPLACDVVAMDLIISEWPEYGSLNYCDEYLREAATIPNTLSGTTYMQDGKPLEKPLGLMEHCDKERNYKILQLIYKKL